MFTRAVIYRGLQILLGLFLQGAIKTTPQQEAVIKRNFFAKTRRKGHQQWTDR